MARSWANRYALETRPGKLVHHSTYRDLPRAMLGERFWADAEHLQRTNPAAFRHEYGGEVVGSGAAVFANLQLRAVPDDELERYDRVYYGVDWGWYPDPWAYNAVAYDAARRVLVIFDELTRSRTPNRETAELLLARGRHGRPADGGRRRAEILRRLPRRRAALPRSPEGSRQRAREHEVAAGAGGDHH